MLKSSENGSSSKHFMTALIVVGLTIFAFQTKYDFTRFNGFIVALLMWGIMLLMFNFVFIMDTRFAYTLCVLWRGIHVLLHRP